MSLAHAAGTNLDAIAANYNVARLVVQQAEIRLHRRYRKLWQITKPCVIARNWLSLQSALQGLKQVISITPYLGVLSIAVIADLDFPPPLELPSQRDVKKRSSSLRWLAGEVVRYAERKKARRR